MFLAHHMFMVSLLYKLLIILNEPGSFRMERHEDISGTEAFLSKPLGAKEAGPRSESALPLRVWQQRRHEVWPKDWKRGN